jgi:hypothetical protein
VSIAFRSVSTLADTSATLDSLTGTYYLDVDKPAGLSTGDMMVVVVESGSNTALPTLPGWAMTFTALGSGSLIAYKVATADDVAASTLRIAFAGNAAASVSWYAYSGAKTATVATGTLSTTAPSAPSVTARQAGVALRVFNCYTPSSPPIGLNSSAPIGTALRSATTYPHLRQIVGVDETISGAGVSGTRSTTTVSWPAAPTTVMLEGNHAPDTASITSPAAGAVFGDGEDVPLAWIFNDIDGDTQGSADVRYSTDGGSTWTTVTGATGSGQAYTLSGLAPGSYQAQVKVYDSSSTPAANWSSSRHFTISEPLDPPTIVTPTDGATVDATATVAATADAVTAWQVRRVADIAGAPDVSTVYYDSGLNPSTSDLDVQVSFPVDGRDEHIQVRYTSAGAYSSWADALVTVAWTPPATPDLTITASGSSAAIEVDITTALAGIDSDAVSVDLLASPDDGATVEWADRGIDPNSTSIFYTPASGRNYSFKAIAYAADGAPAETDWIGSASFTFSDLWTVIFDGGDL